MSGKRDREEFEDGHGDVPHNSSGTDTLLSSSMISQPMTPEEEVEARRLAEIAERAELKAAERARARAAQQATESNHNHNVVVNRTSDSSSSSTSTPPAASVEVKEVKFLTKKEREALALQRLHKKREEEEKLKQEALIAHERFVTGKALEERKRQEYLEREKEEQERIRRQKEENKEATELEHEVKAIRDNYLGVTTKKKRIVKPSEKFTRIFQFDWEETDDTAREDYNPLYSNRVKINPLYGRGYIAGIDLREQRKDSNYLTELMSRRMAEVQRNEGNGDGSMVPFKTPMVPIKFDEIQDRRLRAELKGKHWSEKSLSEMNERDWRIFREDFDIRIEGGRASLPMRYWNESGIPSEILQAIEAMGYEQPSPIQRQAIPIGLDRKDIIGIAETGSGKTCAFLVPLLTYMLQLPPHQIKRTCDEGPLAVVMAPTRELAQQIQEECIKLAKFTPFQTCSVVGGQSIEEQGFILRRGVEIVIGTPGRLVDCLENNYLVLNQCNYVVLDEADRMIDMGFEPQVIQVLDAMGGLLKSEDEQLLEQQVRSAKDGRTVYRVTAMFSATMAPEVERIAKRYLRHPVSIKIGDEESGKNRRIEQIVYFVTDGQKKSKIMEQLRRLSPTDKVIIFVNLKRQGDIVGSYASQVGLTCGVIHGGKSQDQREEALDMFRNNDIQILIATDVAGRGLDIPDVTHVINYDMPNKIENYCHRIGRTARAGKSGTAITFITEHDTEVMYDLKSYLESTNAAIPPELAHHQAAQAAVGTRDANSGKLVGERRRDQILYAK